jgi:hypothetical protein
MTFKPWTFFAVALAGWMNRQQQDAIAYLRTENRILREKLGHKHILLNDAQRRCLAEAAAKLGRDLLRQFGTLFSPDTLLRWNRMLIASKYDGSGGKRGPKPKKANFIRKLVLQMAAENPGWGYGRIYGELKKLGYKVSWQTVRRVMLDAGLLPDPDKPYKTTWKTFIQSHWEPIAAADFFSVEAWGLNGLTRYLVFFVIDVSTRRVQIVGIHADPCEKQMLQWGRNFTDADDGFLKDKRVLIHDRDPLFTKKFQEILRAGGVRCLKMPKWSPNLNQTIFVGSDAGTPVARWPNHPCVRRQTFTSISITGTSISTPTTVARAAPLDRPYSMVAVAMATSKWLLAPIMADGAASA